MSLLCNRSASSRISSPWPRALARRLALLRRGIKTGSWTRRTGGLGGTFAAIPAAVPAALAGWRRLLAGRLTWRRQPPRPPAQRRACQACNGKPRLDRRTVRSLGFMSGDELVTDLDSKRPTGSRPARDRPGGAKAACSSSNAASPQRRPLSWPRWFFRRDLDQRSRSWCGAGFNRPVARRRAAVSSGLSAEGRLWMTASNRGSARVTLVKRPWCPLGLF